MTPYLDRLTASQLRGERLRPDEAWLVEMASKADKLENTDVSWLYVIFLLIFIGGVGIGLLVASLL